MEVTTVSPSPTSPTEGEDLCEIDVTNVAIHSVTLLLSLCGLVGNGAVVCLLSLKDHNRGIYGLALADFLFLLFTVPSALLFLVEDLFCSPIMPQLYLNFLFQLSAVSYYWALFRLIYINDMAYTYRLCLLCCRCVVSLRLQWVVYYVQYWALFALFIVIPAVTNLCPSHQQEHCQAALIFMHVLILLLFPAPILIFHTIDFIKAMRGSKKQQPKRRDLVVFPMVLFIVLLSLCNFLQDLAFIIVPSQVFFLLNCTHSSIKPFIYFLAGGFQRPCSLRSLQLSLQRVFDEQKEETAHSSDTSMDTMV
ncbi:mas-related G-protein coupled receptor member A8-like [Chamaea fasciata]|uniref:mas-related G-protein coupled receptor member A8-like n=1 Tax=Chamaea fasciata TaxID=190680 RepID=UPI003369EC0B